ncbi:MAG: FkbM family methyltransferase [Bacteroidota bacterium]
MNSAEHILSTLLRIYRPGTDIVTACQSLNDHPDNPSLLALSDTLSQYGIPNRAFKLTFTQLSELSLPFVAYVTSDKGEYILVTAMDAQNATITNRNCYQVPMVLDSFKLIYAGTALVLEPQGQADTAVHNIPVQQQVLKAPNQLPFEICYVDIGASYGLPVKWERFAADPLLRLIMIEPDKAQADELGLRYPQAEILQVGLGDKHERRNIHLTASQSCSSVLEPNLDVLRRLNLEKWFTVLGQVSTDLLRFDEVYAEKNLPAPDFIKIDVQGFEYEVLKGFGSLLDKILCIELETHLLELYKGQKLFNDIHTLLYSHGFYLRHLEQTGNFNKEAIEFNAYFVRQDVFLDDRGKVKVELWEIINSMPPPKIPRS